MSKLWWVQTEELETLARADLHRLQQFMHRARYDANKVVYSSSLPGDVVYLIQQGQVSLFQETSGGARRKLTQLRRGDLFGSLSLVESGYKQGQVFTDSAVVMLVLRKKSFEQLMKFYPGTGARLVAFFVEQQIQHMKSRDLKIARYASQRLLRLLKHYLDNPAYQVNQEPVPFPINLRELADLLACRTDVIQLCLDNLQSEGIIAIERKTVSWAKASAPKKPLASVKA